MGMCISGELSADDLALGLRSKHGESVTGKLAAFYS